MPKYCKKRPRRPRSPCGGKASDAQNQMTTGSWLGQKAEEAGRAPASGRREKEREREGELDTVRTGYKRERERETKRKREKEKER